MPFVQGHLRKTALEVTIDSQCGHCGEPLRLVIDSALRYRVEGDGRPMVFVPLVDFEKLEAPDMIDDF